MSELAPQVIPMIAYEDGPAAMDWLAKAFGFVEIERRVEPGGRLSHGEMAAGDARSGLIMLATPSLHYQSPRRHREMCAAAARWSETPHIIDGVLVYVDDVDAHFERARAAGATILSAVEYGGPGKRYRAEDLEGHRWMFMQTASTNLVAPASLR
ncbi:MAG: VOC family protein [Candidatus Dormibacteraceae bacterium]